MTYFGKLCQNSLDSTQPLTDNPLHLIPVWQTHQSGLLAVNVLAAFWAAAWSRNRPKQVAPEPDMRVSRQPGASPIAPSTVLISGTSDMAGASRSLRQVVSQPHHLPTRARQPSQQQRLRRQVNSVLASWPPAAATPIARKRRELRAAPADRAVGRVC